MIDKNAEVVITFRDGLIKNLRDVDFTDYGVTGKMLLSQEIVETLIPWDSIKHMHQKVKNNEKA